MNQTTLMTTFGCLLHSVGRLVRRAQAGSVEQGINGPDWLSRQLSGPGAAVLVEGLRAPESSLPFLLPAIKIAAAAVSGADGREPIDLTRPLRPIFTRMKDGCPGMAIEPMEEDGTARMPLPAERVRVDAAAYHALLNGLGDSLRRLPLTPEGINGLLAALERYTSTVPANAHSEASADISLYDHGKITAAIGACLSESLSGKCLPEESLMEQPLFLLYSADFSGIQSFIYTVTTKNALRALRSRSFFLELAMEHYIDELLLGCSVSRANLLYSGGGHCYLLLPNTEQVVQTLTEWNRRFNNWLAEQFGISLYLADGWTACSANDLTNTPTEAAPYREIFRRVSGAIARRKLRRYSPAQIRLLNRSHRDETGRECRICGRSDHLIPDSDGEGEVCQWCDRFERHSKKILAHNVFLVSDSMTLPVSFRFPTIDGETGLTFTDEKTARALLEGDEPIRRIYTKNQVYAELPQAVRLYVGDYAYSDLMEELADESEGIPRLGICRMDVDDLGQAFVSGFEQPNADTPEEAQRYVTISRTAAFSRQMSLFFKGYINDILSGRYQQRDPLAVTVVYSGGDDVFLVGAWTDVMEAAARIRSAFHRFTCHTLAISGGITLFQPRHPIRLGALQTAELEDASKELPGKDGITVFAVGQGHTYHWDTFLTQVMGEKEQTLRRFFRESGQRERGNAFLYRLLTLLREADPDRQKPIQLARYAYLLARLEPPRNSPQHSAYQEFANHMYHWALDTNERKQLITAIYIFVYRNRAKGGTSDGD